MHCRRPGSTIMNSPASSECQKRCTMPTLIKGLRLLLFASVFVTAAAGTGDAAAENALGEVHPRFLQQARPSTMNLPILAADDMERGFSSMGRSNGRPQQARPQQQQRGGQAHAASFFGRRLLQQGPPSRRWRNQDSNPTAHSNRDFQPWGSQPIDSNLHASDFGQTSSADSTAATQGAPVTWDNTDALNGVDLSGNRGGLQSARANARSNARSKADNRSNRGRSRNNRGDLSSLQALTGSTNGWATARGGPITATGTAGTLSQRMRRRGNARAAAQSLAQAYSAGQSEAAAQAVASAATVDDGAEAVATAEAVAEATVNYPRVAPQLLAKSAGLAASRGRTKQYARTMADAFKYAKRKKTVPQFTRSVADAIATGGAPTRYVYGQAIATAIAAGGEGQAAVAEATATAFCEGGSTATAWAQAYAVALSQDSQGCLVLNQAKALAQARCGAQGAEALSEAEATSTVLGFCGLMDLIPGGISYNWAGGSSGSNSIQTESGDHGGLFDSWGNK